MRIKPSLRKYMHTKDANENIFGGGRTVLHIRDIPSNSQLKN